EHLSRQRDELHAVGPRGQPCEQVVAVQAGRVVVGGGGGLYHRGALQQLHRHPVDARLAGVLDAIDIGACARHRSVEPDEVADAGRPVVAEVDGQVAAAAGQGRRGGAAGAGVAVGGRRALAGGGGGEAGQGAAGAEVGGVDANGVGARGQAAEQVAAVAAGGGMLRDRDAGPGGAAQGQGDAVDARLAAVLDAVAVEVVPHEVAHAGRPVEAEVDGLVEIGRASCRGRGEVGAGGAAGGRPAVAGGGGGGAGEGAPWAE